VNVETTCLSYGMCTWRSIRLGATSVGGACRNGIPGALHGLANSGHDSLVCSFVGPGCQYMGGDGAGTGKPVDVTLAVSSVHPRTQLRTLRLAE
jgi:hypothetical protein